MQFSVSVRNGMLDAIETAMGASPQLWLHTGAKPANCATARSGTQLLDMNLPADAYAAASSGTKDKTGTWSAATSAAGQPGYYSIMDSAGTTCHEQGLVSQAWAISTAYVLNQQVHAGGNVYKATTAGTSAGSGSGPTGTGTGITDGSAVWDYVGAVDATITNSNPASGDTVTVATKSYTAPNA